MKQPLTACSGTAAETHERSGTDRKNTGGTDE